MMFAAYTSAHAQSNVQVYGLLDMGVDITNNAPSGGFAGSITCALFLQRFVEHAGSWLHVDIYGWTPSAKPARPEGGECQAARAIYTLLSERYA